VQYGYFVGEIFRVSGLHPFLRFDSEKPSQNNSEISFSTGGENTTPPMDHSEQ